jgi:hypothetical protein
MTIFDLSIDTIRPGQDGENGQPDFTIGFIKFYDARYTLFKNTARDGIYVIPPFSSTPVPFANPAEAIKWAKRDAFDREYSRRRLNRLKRQDVNQPAEGFGVELAQDTDMINVIISQHHP